MPQLQLGELQTGFEFPVVSLRLTPEVVERYRQAIGDDSPIYKGPSAPVPPSGVLALSLGALLQTVVFPPGLMHVSQEVELLAPAMTGAELVCRCTVRNRSTRMGNVFLGLEFTTFTDDVETLKARTNLLFPLGREAATQ